MGVTGDRDRDRGEACAGSGNANRVAMDTLVLGGVGRYGT